MSEAHSAKRMSFVVLINCSFVARLKEVAGKLILGAAWFERVRLIAAPYIGNNDLRGAYAPQGEQALEAAMLKCVVESEKLPGKTFVLVDISGSMTAPLSRRSEMLRTDAAYGLAVLLREIGEKVALFSFSNELVEVPARRGFALRDAIDVSQQHGATYLGKAVEKLNERERSTTV